MADQEQTDQQHQTYVEVDGAGYYWWCTGDDCYAATRRRYATEMEAAEAAAEHADHPG